MYFLEEGTVRITKSNEEGGKEREVSKLSSGSYFGELALITHKPRAANVYADSDTVKVACESLSFFTFSFSFTFFFSFPFLSLSLPSHFILTSFPSHFLGTNRLVFRNWHQKHLSSRFVVMRLLLWKLVRREERQQDRQREREKESTKREREMKAQCNNTRNKRNGKQMKINWRIIGSEEEGKKRSAEIIRLKL